MWRGHTPGGGGIGSHNAAGTLRQRERVELRRSHRHPDSIKERGEVRRCRLAGALPISANLAANDPGNYCIIRPQERTPRARDNMGLASERLPPISGREFRYYWFIHCLPFVFAWLLWLAFSAGRVPPLPGHGRRLRRPCFGFQLPARNTSSRAAFAGDVVEIARARVAFFDLEAAQERGKVGARFVVVALAEHTEK